MSYHTQSWVGLPVIEINQLQFCEMNLQQLDLNCPYSIFYPCQHRVIEDQIFKTQKNIRPGKNDCVTHRFPEIKSYRQFNTSVKMIWKKKKISVPPRKRYRLTCNYANLPPVLWRNIPFDIEKSRDRYARLDFYGLNSDDIKNGIQHLINSTKLNVNDSDFWFWIWSKILSYLFSYDTTEPLLFI